MPAISSPVQYTTAPQGVADEQDYDYFWSHAGVDVPIPRWLAEIVAVAPMARLVIFLVGTCAGLIVAAIAILVGFYIALG